MDSGTGPRGPGRSGEHMGPPSRPPVVDEGATPLGQGSGRGEWAVSALERDGKPTLEIRFHGHGGSPSDYRIVGKSGNFRVPAEGFIDQIATVDSGQRFVFGVSSRAVATIPIEISDGTPVDVAPQRPGLVGGWPFDTFFVQLPADPGLAGVVALDIHGDVLQRIAAHERRSAVGGRQTPAPPA